MLYFFEKYISNLYNSPLIYPHVFQMNWDDAQKFCRALQLELASIETAEEHQRINKHIETLGTFSAAR